MKKELPEFSYNDLFESMKEGVSFAQGKLAARTFTVTLPQAPGQTTAALRRAPLPHRQ
jgi:hypothetical protein